MLLDIAKGSCCISNGFGGGAAAVSVPPCPYPALVSWICLLAESSSYRLSSNRLSNPPAYKYKKRKQAHVSFESRSREFHIQIDVVLDLITSLVLGVGRGLLLLLLF